MEKCVCGLCTSVWSLVRLVHDVKSHLFPVPVILSISVSHIRANTHTHTHSTSISLSLYLNIYFSLQFSAILSSILQVSSSFIGHVYICAVCVYVCVCLCKMSWAAGTNCPHSSSQRSIHSSRREGGRAIERARDLIFLLHKQKGWFICVMENFGSYRSIILSDHWSLMAVRLHRLVKAMNWYEHQSGARSSPLYMYLLLLLETGWNTYIFHLHAALNSRHTDVVKLSGKKQCDIVMWHFPNWPKWGAHILYLFVCLLMCQ